MLLMRAIFSIRTLLVKDTNVRNIILALDKTEQIFTTEVKVRLRTAIKHVSRGLPFNQVKFQNDQSTKSLSTDFSCDSVKCIRYTTSTGYLDVRKNWWC